MRGWRNEIRVAVRGLVRRPVFALQATVTVALGTLGLTTVYPMMHRVVLRPLPYEAPDRLAAVRTALDREWMGVTVPELLHLAEQEGLFEDVAAVLPPQYDQSFTWTDASPRERLRAVQVTPNFFELLGVEVVGPGFDDDPSSGGQVILSHGFWASRFGDVAGEHGSAVGTEPDPGGAIQEPSTVDRRDTSGPLRPASAIGRTLALNDAPQTVVGVLPQDFEFPLAADPFDVWVVRRLDSAMPPSNDNRVFRMVARLAAGATIEAARARVPGLIEAFHREHGTDIRVARTEVRSLHEDLVGPVRTPLLLLTGAALVVLVVAALNLALLLSARNLARGTELAVRRAVGAGTGRIARLLLIEASVIALGGVAVGAVLGRATLSTLDLASAAGAGRLPDGPGDLAQLPVLAAVMVLGVVVGTALVPAFRAARSASLSARGGGGGQDVRRSIAWVVGVESALVFGLLVAGGLTLISLEALTRVDPGFDPRGAIALEVRLPDGKYEAAEVPGVFERAAERLEALPGVTRVGSVTHLPLDGDNWGGQFAIEGRDHPAPDALPLVDWEFASPGYFEAAGIPILEGRAFSEDDVHDAPLVAIINETLVRRYFPDESPVGARVNGNGFDGTWFTVVGVAGDVKQQGLEHESRGYLYMSSLQSLYWPERQMVVRTATSDPVGVVPQVRTELLSVDPDLTIGTVRSLVEVVHRASGAFRLRALVFGSLGVIAALLGMAGIHGVASHGVQARRREVGIRLAVGADRGRVFRMMLTDGLRPVLVGMLGGVVLSWVAGRWLQGYLYGVDGDDPAVLVGIAGLLTLAALAAVVPAALRARRVDPVRMLQE